MVADCSMKTFTKMLISENENTYNYCFPLINTHEELCQVFSAPSFAVHAYEVSRKINKDLVN